MPAAPGPEVLTPGARSPSLQPVAEAGQGSGGAKTPAQLSAAPQPEERCSRVLGKIAGWGPDGAGFPTKAFPISRHPHPCRVSLVLRIPGERGAPLFPPAIPAPFNVQVRAPGAFQQSPVPSPLRWNRDTTPSPPPYNLSL